MQFKGGIPVKIGKGPGLLAAAVTTACLVLSVGSHAGPTDAQKCLSSKYKIISKYDLCVLKSEAKAAQLGITADTSLCDSKFSEQWAKPDAKFGADCPGADASVIAAEVDDHMDTIKQLLGVLGGPCSLLTQNCGSGEGCYLSSETETVCLAAGSGTSGEACFASNDCAAGFDCLDGGMGTFCFEYCNASGGAPSCTPPDSCEAQPQFGTDVGVCIAP